MSCCSDCYYSCLDSLLPHTLITCHTQKQRCLHTVPVQIVALHMLITKCDYHVFLACTDPGLMQDSVPHIPGNDKHTHLRKASNLQRVSPSPVAPTDQTRANTKADSATCCFVFSSQVAPVKASQATTQWYRSHHAERAPKYLRGHGGPVSTWLVTGLLPVVDGVDPTKLTCHASPGFGDNAS